MTTDHSDILTKNDRNWHFLRLNSLKAKRIVDSKTWTKKVLSKAEISVPKKLGLLKSTDEINNFKWEGLEGNFVVKPTKGYGGEGVLVIKRKAKWAGEWFLMDGRKVNITDLRFHCLEILQGRFSLHGWADKALVEERIKIHPNFFRFTRVGTPDIRIIAFNKIPIMAMLRIPTEESQGKANLHQGAIGVGIDLATGITTFGITTVGTYYSREIDKIWDYKRKKKIKINGIRIPNWKQILKVALQAQAAIEGLNYGGVDIVLDAEKGPMVLELNARPGLWIQNCNKAGLKSRLEKAKGIRVRSLEHGINIAQHLFSESFADQVISKEGVNILEIFEPIKIRGADGKKMECWAKIDTGALRSSIDKELADLLGLTDSYNLLYYRHYRSSMGKGRRRPVVGMTFWLKGKKIKTAANVAQRGHMAVPVIIGRRDLQGFLVRAEPLKFKY